MPYREKIAWLSIAAIVLTFTPYFVIVATTPHSSAMPNLHQLLLFAEVVTAQVIILAGGNIVLAVRTPNDARLPADERDRAIASRGITLAYYVLICGTILIGCVMPFVSAGWQIVNAALFAIQAAELVHYGTAVVSYRRQA
jgi:hypothetical protein